MSTFTKGTKQLRAIFAATALIGSALVPATANANPLLTASLFALALSHSGSTHKIVSPEPQAQPQPQQYYYPYYYPEAPEDYYQLCNQEHSGAFTATGIGVRLTETDNGFAVLHTLEGGPADRAGIRVGDLLTTINGKPVKSIEQANKEIVGEAGTDVTITLKRNGAATPLAFHPKRERLEHWQCTVLLHEAVEHGDNWTTRELLQKDAKPATTMLPEAVHNSDSDIARSLMEYGAKPTTEMLDSAIRRDDFLTAGELMKNGVKPTLEMYTYAKQRHYTSAWDIKEYLPRAELFNYAVRRDRGELINFVPEFLGVSFVATVALLVGSVAASEISSRRYIKELRSEAAGHKMEN